LSEATLLLLGAEAVAQAPRLEASGYSCLIGDASAADWPRCHLALLAGDQQGRMAELQQRLPGIPLLLDIGNDSVAARSRLLQAGASDFWLSSQGASDLLLRLRLHLKLIHKGQPSRDRLSLADLSVVPSRHEVRRGARSINLTAREYALLVHLLEHRGQVLSREHILQQVWHDQQGAASNVIEVYVRYLRQKLEEGGEKRLIHTVRGQGYCLSDGPPKLS
jgi:two-component system, OmpR family, response regulator MprA